MYITSETIITTASVISALAVIGGVALWILKFVQRQKRQDEELKLIRKELTMLCYGSLACLKGLKEQGCNGPVTEALQRLEKYLNNAAHDQTAQP